MLANIVEKWCLRGWYKNQKALFEFRTAELSLVDIISHRQH
ncbi:hypothetical protein [Endozoicomonas sp. SCSIO W0465]|nr:hypothetical protein [Endozoicomonas sp. SCSIO W0465]